MQRTEPLGRALLLLLVLLSWLGVLLQLWLSAQLAVAGGFSWLSGVWQALSYFTVLTNLWVAIVSSAQLRAARWLRARAGILAACAVYIGVVGLIYSLLLRSTWAPAGLQKLADVLLHDVVPAAYLLWWLGFAPKQRAPWSAALWWLAYPLAYMVFTVLGGLRSGRYPYPFADIGALGLATALRNALLLLGLFYLLALAALALVRWSGRRPAIPRGGDPGAR
jgi:hypothetical protein